MNYKNTFLQIIGQTTETIDCFNRHEVLTAHAISAMVKVIIMRTWLSSNNCGNIILYGSSTNHKK